MELPTLMSYLIILLVHLSWLISPIRGAPMFQRCTSGREDVSSLSKRRPKIIKIKPLPDGRRNRFALKPGEPPLWMEGCVKQERAEAYAQKCQEEALIQKHRDAYVQKQKEEAPADEDHPDSDSDSDSDPEEVAASQRNEAQRLETESSLADIIPDNHPAFDKLGEWLDNHFELYSVESKGTPEENKDTVEKAVTAVNGDPVREQGLPILAWQGDKLQTFLDDPTLDEKKVETEIALQAPSNFQAPSKGSKSLAQKLRLALAWFY